MRFRHLVVALAVLGLLATAAAQCERGPTTSSVTLPDFLAVYFAQFRSFSEQDAAEFYGGVCVTAVGGEWTVMADSVRLDGLSDQIQLEAPEPILYFGEWRIHGDLLKADATGLTLVNAVLDGPDASGSASGLDVDLLTGEMTLVGVELAGTAFAVRGDLAVLEGTSLRVEGAGLTTCIGLEEAPYEVLGAVAQVDLTAREVRIHSGSLRVGRITVPLRDEVVVSEAAFADFELPVKVAFVEGPAERVGAGLDIRIVGIPMAEGVDLVVGGTGLDAEHTTAAVALLEIGAEVEEAQGASRVDATVGVQANSPYLDFRIAREVAPWLRVGFGVLSGAAPAKEARHEGRMSVTASTSVPLFGPDAGVRAALTAEAFAAVTAVTAAAGVAQPRVAGPRLGAAAGASTSWRATSVSTFGFGVGAEATYYPRTWVAGEAFAGPTLQWGVRLTPSWRYANGPITLSLAYDARFTNAASPFPTSVDRLTPLQRLQGNLRLAGEIAATAGGTVSGALGVQATYDPFATSTPAGLKRLLVEGSVAYEAAPWTLAAAARTELSGLLAATGREPYVELDLTATRGGWPVLNPAATSPPVPHGTFQVGLLTNYSLEPGEEGLAALELSAAVPLAFETWELRPYLAFDFEPTVTRGMWPWWSGYGLDATFITCCGSFTLGVLNDRGEWSAGIGIDLERRPPAKDGEGALDAGPEREPGGVGIMPGDE